MKNILAREVFVLIHIFLFFFISCSKTNDQPDEIENILNLTTPYVNETDIESINEAFSLHDEAPWGFRHVGIDFFPSESLKQFKTSCAGIVSNVELWKNKEKWQVNIVIDCDEKFKLLYSFEPFTKNEAVGEEQLRLITIKTGETIKKDDIIGELVLSNGTGHVHFSLKYNNEFICPEKYFTQDAYNSIMRIIHKTHPDWDMCY